MNMEEKALCVIPARYASTRLPGKPLKDIAGQPMICRVYDRAKKAQRTAATIVATDDKRIETVVLAHGGKACGVVFARAVAEVHAQHVGAGEEELADHREVGACGPQGGDDLGAAGAVHGGGVRGG